MGNLGVQLTPHLRANAMEIFGRILAGIGAAGVLAALTFVSVLIGILVHGMIILMAGKPIDDYLRKKGEKVFEPGSLR